MRILSECSGFEWDQGNIEKNWTKHNVSPVECEQAFFNEPLIILDDSKHSALEKKYADIYKAEHASKSYFCKGYEPQRKEVL